VSRFGLFWVFFNKVVGKEGEEHSGIWSQIMKLNENNDRLIELSRG
jgi:hypothetical protein